MIVTVTMNPAIDKTVEISKLICGGLDRIQSVEYDAGGKGINVSKTIQELGGNSIATGFLGGNNGKTIANVLQEKGIQCDFVWVDGETRTNTKVFEDSGELTELNEPGPVITTNNLEALKEKLLGYAGEETLFVFAGSVPAGVDKGIYAEFINLLKGKGSGVLLDADGEAFRKAVAEAPDIIKPNRVELEGYAGMDYRASEEELVKIAKGFQDKGVENIVVSMGAAGALFLFQGDCVKCPALSVKAHSPVGAGDAMVAALAYAWDSNLGNEETIKLCMAVSAGAVTTIGTKPPSKEVVDSLLKQVKIERLGV